MDKDTLQDILNLKNFQAIERKLHEHGYRNMAQHPTLKKVSLVPIAKSPSLVSLDWINCYKFSFQANLISDVKEYPNYEFIWLQINKLNKKLDMYIPHIQMIFYKEKNV